MLIDESYVDKASRLAGEPVLISTRNISMEKRKSATAWFLQGIVPPKPLTGEERAKAKYGGGMKTAVDQVYHNCIKIILQELIATQMKDHVTGKATKMWTWTEISPF